MLSNKLRALMLYATHLARRLFGAQAALGCVCLDPMFERRNETSANPPVFRKNQINTSPKKDGVPLAGYGKHRRREAMKIIILPKLRLDDRSKRLLKPTSIAFVHGVIDLLADHIILSHKPEDFPVKYRPTKHRPNPRRYVSTGSADLPGDGDEIFDLCPLSLERHRSLGAGQLPVSHLSLN
jgi:hypothetical protein